MVLYMFLLMYGAMVMQSVIEEKNNRVLEVIVSSVKPFQIMMGKIVGIAMVGLTQFFLWIVLTIAIVGFAGNALAPTLSKDIVATQSMGMDNTTPQRSKPSP